MIAAEVDPIESPSGIYLDASATSPPRLEVIERMRQVQSTAWGNPSSLHQQGLIAAEVMERSRHSIARTLQADRDELVFTSGATESIHLALLGMARARPVGRLVISAVEHPAVNAAAEHFVAQGWDVVRWPVDRFGRVKMNLMEELLSPPTEIVSLIWGQSEIGTLQPIHAIGTVCRKMGIIFHTDATQVLSQGPIDWCNLPVDMLSASAHKFQGPRGIGLLLLRHHLFDLIHPLQGGGGQERGLRAGTEAVALIAGMAEALSLLATDSELDATFKNPSITNIKAIKRQRDDLRSSLESIQGIHITGDPIDRLPHHLSMLVGTANDLPLSGRRVVRELSRLGVSASSGSACHSGQSSDSEVLKAIGVAPKWRQSGLRFSLGPWLNSDQLAVVPDCLQRSLEAAASSG